MCNNTSVYQSSSEIEFNIYPNPTSEHTVIHSNDNQPYLITVTDVSGQIIIEKLISEPDYTLNTADLSPGLYFVYRKTNTQQKAVKLIIK